MRESSALGETKGVRLGDVAVMAEGLSSQANAERMTTEFVQWFWGRQIGYLDGPTTEPR